MMVPVAIPAICGTSLACADSWDKRGDSAALDLTGVGAEPGAGAEPGLSVAVAQTCFPVASILQAGALRRGRWSAPAGERVRQARVGWLSDPGDVSVGPDQHGGGSGDRAKYRKLPQAVIVSIDQLDPVSPWSDVEATRAGAVA
jgi:hypothetical protein